MLSIIAALALAPLTVTVETENPTGMVYVQLCDRESFLTSQCPHQTNREAEARIDFVFDDVAPGEWTVMVWRDANSNGEMERGQYGVPLEPTSISNDPPMLYGPPRFDDAKVAVPDNGTRVRISIR
jgi:uncharacterized protein (DUF2141 family)